MATKKLHSTAPKNNYLRDLITSWVIVFLIGLVLGVIVASVFHTLCKAEELPNDEPNEIKPDDTESIEYVLTEEDMMLAIPEVPSWEWEEYEAPTEVEKELLGTFRITAYCSCKKCCGKWADNRPNGIVYGASGAELVAGVSVASPLPFGTEIYIDGLGDYVVQDRLAKWVVEKYGENLIDVYFDNHEEAWNFGCKYLDVYKA
jgi:3D (Asp-Asp-Asp) domain-containing protein